MRIIDKNDPTDIEWFWVTVGMRQGKAFLADRQDDIQIEVSADVVEALQKQAAPEGRDRLYYYLGIKFAIDDVLNAEVAEAAKLTLMMKIGEVSHVKVSVTKEKRKVEKTTVTEHTKDGKIQSFIKEQIAI